MSRPKVYESPRITTAVRFPESLLERLKGAAADRDVSANLIINRAVEKYLNELSERELLP